MYRITCYQIVLLSLLAAFPPISFSDNLSKLQGELKQLQEEHAATRKAVETLQEHVNKFLASYRQGYEEMRKSLQIEERKLQELDMRIRNVKTDIDLERETGPNPQQDGSIEILTDTGLAIKVPKGKNFKYVVSCKRYGREHGRDIGGVPVTADEYNVDFHVKNCVESSKTFNVSLTLTVFQMGQKTPVTEPAHYYLKDGQLLTGKPTWAP